MAEDDQQDNDKEESVLARIRPWAHKIIEDIAGKRNSKLDQLKKQKSLTTDDNELSKLEKQIGNIKTKYVDITSELILIGSSNLIDSGIEYYVEGDKARLSYEG